MKKFFYFGLTLIGFVLIASFIINTFSLSEGPYFYTSSDGVYFVGEIEKMHNSYELVIKGFEEYKKMRPGLKLHRLFYFKWWHFWHWGNYLFEPRWRLSFSNIPNINEAVQFSLNSTKKTLYLSVDSTLNNVDVRIQRYEKQNLICCAPIWYKDYNQNEIKLDTFVAGNYSCFVDYKKVTIFWKSFEIQ